MNLSPLGSGLTFHYALFLLACLLLATCLLLLLLIHLDNDGVDFFAILLTVLRLLFGVLVGTVLQLFRLHFLEVIRGLRVGGTLAFLNGFLHIFRRFAKFLSA